jgi:non-ribosomal peptide synthetase component E (peptide arylation enzyme)
MLNIGVDAPLLSMQLTLDDKQLSREEFAQERDRIGRWLVGHGVTQNAVLLAPGLSNGILTLLTPAVTALNLSLVLTHPSDLKATLYFAHISGAEWLCADAEISDDTYEEVGYYNGVTGSFRLYRLADIAERPFQENGVVYFTSGTTTASRAVFRSWSKLFAEVTAYQKHLNLPNDAEIAALVPLYHSYGFGSALINSLSLGAHMHSTNLLLPASFRKLLCKEYYDLVITSPQTLWLCGKANDEIQGRCKTGLVISSGAPLSIEGAQMAKIKLGWEVRQQYGSSETGAISVSQGDDSATKTVGQPLPGVSVTIAFDNEIEVASAYAATEYLQDNSRGRFADGVFRPGDCGYFNPSGDLVITGRIDDEVTVAGRRIRLLNLQRFLESFAGVELARVR